MAGLAPKLSYIATQHRVKVEFGRAICMQDENPPDDLFKRAISKLESVQKDGKIASYEIFEDRIRKLWQEIRVSKEAESNRQIVMTLGLGTPELTGLTVVESANPKALVDISISASQVVVAQWYVGWVELTINREVMKLGKTESVNPAQVKGAMLRAITGQKIENLSISATPDAPTPEEAAAKPYSLVANKARKEISLIVRDVSILLEKLNTTGTVDLAVKSAKKLEAQTGDKYRVLKTEIIESIDAIINGPESMNFDMPAIILCGVGAESEKVAVKFKKPSALEVEVGSDLMLATISCFSMGIYDDQNVQMTRKWFAKQLQNIGFPKACFVPHLDDLVAAASRKEDLTGCVVSEGRMPVNGAFPFLFDVLADESNRDVDSVDFDNDVVDIRGMRQQSLCSPGSLVAEIRYNEAAEDGMDVWGTIIPPKVPDDFRVTVGEGIQQQNGGKFYAMTDGVAMVEANAVSLSVVMIHKGDINLRTGNISFDGPVEIHGSIDSGAEVEASGDITVLGNVRGAIIRSGGKITVKGGVITGENGKLEAIGDIQAEFIENSNIHCQGRLIARKSIINTTATVGESIQVTDRDGGIIAGGYLTCKNNIYAPNLGFKRGAITKLKVGVDWRVERAVAIRSGRLERVIECQKRDRLEMREITGKSKAQMTRKHVERKQELLERVRKARVIIDTLDEQLVGLRSKLSFNMESMVFVAGFLSNNLEINIGGINLAIPQDMAGVGLLAKRKRGSHILPVEEAEKLCRMARKAS